MTLQCWLGGEEKRTVGSVTGLSQDSVDLVVEEQVKVERSPGELRPQRCSISDRLLSQRGSSVRLRRAYSQPPVCTKAHQTHDRGDIFHHPSCTPNISSPFVQTQLLCFLCYSRWQCFGLKSSRYSTSAPDQTNSLRWSPEALGTIQTVS